MHENKMIETKPNEEQEGKLNGAIAEVKQKLASAERGDLLARHAVAVVILEVKDAAKYGENALERMQEEIGLDRATLYRYASVAEAWTKTDFAKLCDRTNSKQMPLTWSHLELLATVRDGRSRKALLERALKEALTVRGLSAAMKGKGGGKERPEDGEEADSLEELVREMEKTEHDVAAWDRTLSTVFADATRELTSEEYATARNMLARMESLSTKLYAVSELLNRRLRSRTPEKDASGPTTS